MKLEELYTVLSDYERVRIFDIKKHEIAFYDGKDSILEELNIEEIDTINAVENGELHVVLKIEHNNEIAEKSGELLRILENENLERYTEPLIIEMCSLCLEYLTLEGLEDAKRASDIENEIFDLCEKYINN